MEEEEIKEGYTRVSDILHKFSGFDDAPEFVKAKADHKAEIGTEVHKAIRLYYLCVPYGPLSEEAQPYFDSFLSWDMVYHPKPKILEERYYDPTLMITGQIDALMSFEGSDPLVMLDWKTSSSWNKKMETSWLLQGTFYHYLMEYNEVPNVGNEFVFVQLSGEGKRPNIREFAYSVSDLADCMAGLQMYRRFYPIKEKKEKKENKCGN